MESLSLRCDHQARLLVSRRAVHVGELLSLISWQRSIIVAAVMVFPSAG
jgi:hypothetical protein